MRRWTALFAAFAVGMIVVFVGNQAATGATTRTLSYDAAALIAWDNDSGAQQQFTTHTAAGVTPCPDPVTRANVEAGRVTCCWMPGKSVKRTSRYSTPSSLMNLNNSSALPNMGPP
jgi:hypothetical protein